MTTPTTTIPVRPFRLLSGVEGRALPWSTALPVRTPRAVATQSFELAINHRLVELEPSLLTPIAEAIRTWWPLSPKRARGLELVLVQPNGAREKLVLHPPVIRIGRDASCHLQLSANTVSREHAEIRVEEDRLWLTDLDSTSGTWVNGYRLEPREQRPLVGGDQIDLHPFRLVIGRMDVEAAAPSVTLRPGRALAMTGDPFAQLGAAEALWLRVAAGPRTLWVRLPSTWLTYAYRVLGYPPPSGGTEPHNPVDLALTAMLLGRAAASLGEALGIPLEVSAPLPPTTARALAGAAIYAAWEGSTLELDLSGILHEVVALWEAGSLGDTGTRPRTWSGLLADLPFPLAVELGVAVLASRDLLRLEPGDIVLPDSWWPRDLADPTVAEPGPVRLRVQSWSRGGRLQRGEPGQPASVRIESATWSIAPKGASMGPSSPSPTEVGAPATNLPDELESLVVFELDRISVPLRDLVSWQAGATLLLERGAEDPIRIVLDQPGGSRLLGHGKVVLVDGKLGVQIEQWLVGAPR